MERLAEGNRLVLMLQGDLTAVRVKDMVEKARDILDTAGDYSQVALDFSSVQNIDSMGISFVVGLYKTVSGGNRLFSVTGLNHEINKLFKLMKLNEVFPIEPVGAEKTGHNGYSV